MKGAALLEQRRTPTGWAGAGSARRRYYSDGSNIAANPVSRKVPMSMTPRQSLARILNTMGRDFENVAEEEEKRQRDLKALRDWSLQVLGWPIHPRPLGAWA